MWESPLFLSLCAFRSICSTRFPGDSQLVEDKIMSKIVNSKNKLAQAALSVVLIASGLAHVSPALAQQYSGQVQEDTLLPPEVVPFEPAVARQMAEAQAKARAQASEMASSGGSYGRNSAMAGDPSMMNGMSSGMPGGMTSQQTRQDMMNNLMSQGNGGGQPMNMSSPSNVPGTPGTSDWIMPGQSQNAPTTAFGNVSQTQTLTAPPATPPVRRSISRGGLGMAGSALATFGAGALVGSMIRGRGSMTGLGMTGLMMTGFGTRNAFRF